MVSFSPDPLPLTPLPGTLLGWSGPANAASGLAAHASPAGGSGIGNGLQHPETSPVFPGKHGSTDKIARQLILTFFLDNNTHNRDRIVVVARSSRAATSQARTAADEAARRSRPWVEFTEIEYLINAIPRDQNLIETDKLVVKYANFGSLPAHN